MSYRHVYFRCLRKHYGNASKETSQLHAYFLLYFRQKTLNKIFKFKFGMKKKLKLINLNEHWLLIRKTKQEIRN